MVKMAFSQENKQKSDFDYPKLFLDYGESARVVLIEPEPEAFWTHTLKAPVIVNGQAVMETVKGKNGTYEQPKTDFLVRALCMGQENILLEKEKDVTNCPMCAAANASDHVDIAKRRYATNVIQYKTKPGSFEVQTPFQAELVVWSFTNMVFDVLIGIGSEHGDLRTKDLLLGPCENKNFQKFGIQVGGECKWLASEESKTLVQRLYAENKVDDLMPMLGRKISREKAEEYIDQILMKSRQAFGGGDVSPSVGTTSEASSALDLDSMLGAPSEPAPTPAPEPTAPAQDPWTPPSTPEPDPAPAATTQQGGVPDLEDLLKGI